MLLGRCLVCGEPMERGPLCPGCEARLRAQFYDSVCQRCPACFSPLPFPGYRCRFCADHPGLRLYVASPYEGFSAKILERLKFFGRRDLAKVAGWVFRNRIQTIADPESVLVVPAPASARGRRMRGYDQMELAARATGLPWRRLLERVDKDEQKALDRKGRLEAGGRLFRLREGETVPDGRTIIVIDDIITTGATIMGAMEALGAPKADIVGMVWMGEALR